jgi:hypothetical protein
MFAGKMKLSSFLVIAAVLVAGGVTAMVLNCKSSDEGGDKTTAGAPDEKPPDVGGAEPVTSASAPRPQPAVPEPDTPPTSRAEASSPVREVDRVVMGWKGKDLGADKKKDVTKGRGYKVNLYQEEGKTSVNRAKIDLDRDDKWDEKWTFDGETVSRKVAPADDESYTEESVWDGSGWVAAE